MKVIKLVLDPDDDNFDIPCHKETQGEGAYLEHLIIPDLPLNGIDQEEKLHRYLSEEWENLNQVRVILDVKKGLFVEDSSGNLLREIEFKPDFTSDRDTRIVELIKKLLAIL
jgi:hypothetical protein